MLSEYLRKNCKLNQSNLLFKAHEEPKAGCSLRTEGQKRVTRSSIEEAKIKEKQKSIWLSNNEKNISSAK
jgi:hypothetical protein